MPTLTLEAFDQADTRTAMVTLDGLASVAEIRDPSTQTKRTFWFAHWSTAQGGTDGIYAIAYEDSELGAEVDTTSDESYDDVATGWSFYPREAEAEAYIQAYVEGCLA